MLAALAFVKVPEPVVVHVPGVFVVAEMFKRALLHPVYGPLTTAAAGAFTVSVAVLATLVQGPAASGSFVVQVRVIGVGVPDAGVNEVPLLDAFAKDPVPAGAVHCPAPLAAALMLTGLFPQVTYGPPAFAVAAGLMVTFVDALAG